MLAPTNHIFHHTPDTLHAWFAERGLPVFRAEQVLDWVYRKGVVDPGAMSNMGKRDRELLAAEMTFLSGETVSHQSATDGTQKLLIEWSEGGDSARGRGEGRAVTLPLRTLGSRPDHQTECVMIPAESRGSEGRAASTRRTACISSQVGCPVGCRFCASGLGGLDGNLTAGRIVEQVWRLNHMLGETQRVAQRVRGGDRSAADGGSPPKRSDAPGSPRRNELPEGADSPRRGGLPEGADSSRMDELPNPSRITNVVFMGMGEPLANFANVVHAVRTIAAPWGVGLSARKITISTVGLPRAIEKLTEQLELPVTLALSLHAPNDELRRELIPWAHYSTIAELLGACQGWFKKAGREITLEYILLGGVNDRPEHAAQLAGIAKSLRANINLIRYNEVEPLAFKRPRQEDVLEFQHVLRARGVNTHIRASRGRDIAAACGQLRHETAR